MRQQTAEGREPGVLVQQRDGHWNRQQRAGTAQHWVVNRYEQGQGKNQVGHDLKVQVPGPGQQELAEEVQVPGTQSAPYRGEFLRCNRRFRQIHPALSSKGWRVHDV